MLKVVNGLKRMDGGDFLSLDAHSAQKDNLKLRGGHCIELRA